jgi:hypothetical protein
MSTSGRCRCSWEWLCPFGLITRRSRVRIPPPLLIEAPANAGVSWLYARHDQQLGGGSPLWGLMAPTTSQGQLRRREAGWEGSRRRNRDPRDTWRVGDCVLRVEGGAVRASLQRKAKPVVIKGPSRRRGGCARKGAGLIRGGLRGCPGMPVRRVCADRRVARDGGVREGAARRGEVSRGHMTGGDHQRRKGPNAKPRRRTPVLVGWTLKAANPARGLGGYGCRG